MNLADLCIRRPVFATMLVGALIVLGLFSYDRLGVDLFPDTDFPIVTVTTTLQGASVEEIESTVSKTIEESLNTIDGIDSLRSVSKEGVSFIIIEFVLEKDGDVAAQEVRDKVSTAMAQLPIGTDPPVIDKFDFDAAPIMIARDLRRRELPRDHRSRAKARQGGARDGAGRRSGDLGRRPGPRRSTSSSIPLASRRMACRSRRSARRSRRRTWRLPVAASTARAASGTCGRWAGSAPCATSARSSLRP